MFDATGVLPGSRLLPDSWESLPTKRLPSRALGIFEQSCAFAAWQLLNRLDIDRLPH